MHALPKIPGYQLLEPLGGGPMTCVYAAREQASDAACAVKVLREEWADQSTAIKLLQREARAGLAVRHPHLVRVLDAHVTRTPHFLVMELLAGESLRRRLRRDYRLDLINLIDEAAELKLLKQPKELLAVEAAHPALFEVEGDGRVAHDSCEVLAVKRLFRVLAQRLLLLGFQFVEVLKYALKAAILDQQG